MKYIALIMAGDGEIEMCVGFDTREEAETIGAELFEVYDPTFDRLYVTGIDTLAQARRDIQEMKDAAEQEEWNAHPEGIVIEARMNDAED